MEMACCSSVRRASGDEQCALFDWVDRHQPRLISIWSLLTNMQEIIVPSRQIDVILKGKSLLTTMLLQKTFLSFAKVPSDRTVSARHRDAGGRKKDIKKCRK